MKFGIVTTPQTARSESGHELVDGMLQVATTADDVGFDQILAGQHYLSDFTQLQPIPYLARLTAEVESAELATGIMLLPFYHPVEIAEQVATLDALNDNDTIYGVGAGYRDVEFESFGIPKQERIPRTVECLECSKLLLEKDDVSYDGEYYSVSGVTLSNRPEEPLPIWMAANSNAAVERAARMTDAWYVNPHSTIAEITEQKRKHYDPIREELAKSTTLPIMRETFVAETTEEAKEVAREYLWNKYQRYISWGQDEAMEDTKDLHRPFDELAEDRFLLGTPAEVCEEAERYKEELDASYLIVHTHWPGMPYEQACDSIELIGEEVIPYV